MKKYKQYELTRAVGVLPQRLLYKKKPRSIPGLYSWFQKQITPPRIAGLFLIYFPPKNFFHHAFVCIFKSPFLPLGPSQINYIVNSTKFAMTILYYLTPLIKDFFLIEEYFWNGILISKKID